MAQMLSNATTEFLLASICRKNGEKPMWADMSQYSGISLSVEGVGHQFRRCLISVINLGSAGSLTTVLTGKIGVEWAYRICQL